MIKQLLFDAKELEIEAITDTTLDDIILAYGGDEEIEGGAYLILNKNDLRAFAGLKQQKVEKFTIDYVNSTIDGIPYIINSNCKAITDTNTQAGEYGIAYGGLKTMKCQFSPVELVSQQTTNLKTALLHIKHQSLPVVTLGYQGF